MNPLDLYDPSSILTNTARRMATPPPPPSLDEQPEEEPSIMGSIGGTLLDGLSAVGYALDVFGRPIRRGLAGEDPMGAVDVSGRDLLERWGIAGENKPGLFNDVSDFAGDVGGFLTEVATDPFTYVGPGITKKGIQALAGARGAKVAAAESARVASKAGLAARALEPKIAKITEAMGKEGDDAARMALAEQLKGLRSQHAAETAAETAAKELNAQHVAEFAKHDYGDTWAEQVRRGQRALLSVGNPLSSGAGQSWASIGTGETAAKFAEPFSQAAKLIKTSRPGAAFMGLFDPLAGGASIYEAQEVARNQAAKQTAYGAASADEALNMQDDWKGLERLFGQEPPPAGASPSATKTPPQPPAAPPPPSAGPNISPKAQVQPSYPKINPIDERVAATLAGMDDAGFEGWLAGIGKEYSPEDVALIRKGRADYIAKNTQKQVFSDSDLPLASMKPQGGFKDEFDRAFAELDAKDRNMVPIHQLREAMPQYTQDQFNAEVRKLREQGVLSADSSEGDTIAFTAPQRATHIREGGSTFAYLGYKDRANKPSLRQTSIAQQAAEEMNPEDWNPSLKRKASAKLADNLRVMSSVEPKILDAAQNSGKGEIPHNEIFRALRAIYEDKLRIKDQGLLSNGDRQEMLEAVELLTAKSDMVADWLKKSGREDQIYKHYRDFDQYAAQVMNDLFEKAPPKPRGLGASASVAKSPAPEGYFVQEVADIVRKLSTGATTTPETSGANYYGNKVFISHIWDQYKAAHPDVTREAFDEMLREAHGQRKLTLSRADLVQAMNEADLVPSEIKASKDSSQAYHFVRSDALPPAIAQAPPASGLSPGELSDIQFNLNDIGKAAYYAARQSGETHGWAMDAAEAAMLKKFSDPSAASPATNPIQAALENKDALEKLRAIRGKKAKPNIVDQAREAVEQGTNYKDAPSDWREAVAKLVQNGNMTYQEGEDVMNAMGSVAAGMAAAWGRGARDAFLSSIKVKAAPRNDVYGLMEGGKMTIIKQAEAWLGPNKEFVAFTAGTKQPPGTKKGLVWADEKVAGAQRRVHNPVNNPEYQHIAGLTESKVSKAGEIGKLITLYKQASPTDFVHEFIHAVTPFIPQSDLKVLSDFVSKATGEAADPTNAGAWTRAHHEALAKQWEIYHATGVAPTTALQAVFERLKIAFKKAYESIHQTLESLGVVDKNVKEVFDSWYRAGVDAPLVSPPAPVPQKLPAKVQGKAASSKKQPKLKPLATPQNELPMDQLVKLPIGELAARWSRGELDAGAALGQLLGAKIGDDNVLFGKIAQKLGGGADAEDAVSEAVSHITKLIAEGRFDRTLDDRVEGFILDAAKKKLIDKSREGGAKGGVVFNSEVADIAPPRAVIQTPGEVSDEIKEAIFSALPEGSQAKEWMREIDRMSESLTEDTPDEMARAIARTIEELGKKVKNDPTFKEVKDSILPRSRVVSPAVRKEVPDMLPAGERPTGKRGLSPLAGKIRKKAEPAAEAEQAITGQAAPVDAGISRAEPSPQIPELRAAEMEPNAITPEGQTLQAKLTDGYTGGNVNSADLAESIMTNPQAVDSAIGKAIADSPADATDAWRADPNQAVVVTDSGPAVRFEIASDGAPEMLVNPAALKAATDVAAEAEQAIVPSITRNADEAATAPAVESLPKEIASPAPAPKPAVAATPMEEPKPTKPAKEGKDYFASRKKESAKNPSAKTEPAGSQIATTDAWKQQLKVMADEAISGNKKAADDLAGIVQSGDQYAEQEWARYNRTTGKWPAKADVPAPGPAPKRAAGTSSEAPKSKVPPTQKPPAEPPAPPPKGPPDMADGLPPPEVPKDVPVDLQRVMNKLVQNVTLNAAEQKAISKDPQKFMDFAAKIRREYDIEGQDLYELGVLSKSRSKRMETDVGFQHQQSRVAKDWEIEELTSKGKKTKTTKSFFDPFWETITGQMGKYTGRLVAPLRDFVTKGQKEQFQGFKEGVEGINDFIRQWGGKPADEKMIDALRVAKESKEHFQDLKHLQATAETISKIKLKPGQDRFFDVDSATALFAYKQRIARVKAGAEATHKLFAEMAEKEAGKDSLSMLEALNKVLGKQVDDENLVLGRMLRDNAQMLAAKGVKSIDDLKAMHVPSEMVAQAMRFMRVNATPEYLKPWLAALDWYTDIMKTSLTVMWPANIVRNVTAGQYMNVITAGLEPTIRAMGSAAKIAMGKPLDETLQKYYREMELYGVLDPRSGFRGHGVHRVDDIREIGEHRPTLGGIYKRNAEDTALQAPVLREWSAAGQTAAGMAEVFNRATHYIAMREQKKTPLEALNSTLRAQFDYRDGLTEFERQWMRRLMPFYSFARFNAAFTVDELMKHPGGALAQSIRAANDMREDADIPPWMGGKVVTPIGQSDDGKSVRYLSGLGLPFEEAFERISPDPRRSMQQHAAMLHPLIKAPLEYMTGTQMYSGRELSSLQAYPTGIPEVDQIIFNSPASRAVTSARTVADERKGIPEKALNLLTGAKITDVDVERAREAKRRDDIKRALEASGKSQERKIITRKKDVPLTPEEEALFKEYQKGSKKKPKA